MAAFWKIQQLLTLVVSIVAKKADFEFLLRQSFFKKWANLGLFFFYFRSPQTNNTILQQINAKNGAGIRTHDLQSKSPPITTRLGL